VGEVVSGFGQAIATVLAFVTRVLVLLFRDLL
jgi:hypothetical protein